MSERITKLREWLEVYEKQGALTGAAWEHLSELLNAMESEARAPLDKTGETLVRAFHEARMEGRREGFERAREMAAVEGGNAVARWLGRNSPADGYVAGAIRALQDGGQS